MTETSSKVQIFWLDNDNKLSEDRMNSKILSDSESKEILHDLKELGEYILVSRFPADLDWKSNDGKIHICPTKNKLESLLEKYLELEDYENACIIRDKLKLV